MYLVHRLNYSIIKQQFNRWQAGNEIMPSVFNAGPCAGASDVLKCIYVHWRPWQLAKRRKKSKAPEDHTFLAMKIESYEVNASAQELPPVVGAPSSRHRANGLQISGVHPSVYILTTASGILHICLNV